MAFVKRHKENDREEAERPSQRVRLMEEGKVHSSPFSTASSLLLSIQNQRWHKGRSTVSLESIRGFSQVPSQRAASPEKLMAPSQK